MYYENESANDRRGKKSACASAKLCIQQVSHESQAFQTLVGVSFPDVSWPWAMCFQVALNSRNTLTKVSIRNSIRKN